MSHSYPSNISREQFARILPTLESVRRRTKPRTVDLYDVFCGVLYLLKSGCQWRMLPADFPDWRTCYKYFRQWSERPGPDEDSILEQDGWRGPAKQWTERADQLLYRGSDAEGSDVVLGQVIAIEALPWRSAAGSGSQQEDARRGSDAEGSDVVLGQVIAIEACPVSILQHLQTLFVRFAVRMVVLFNPVEKPEPDIRLAC